MGAAGNDTKLPWYCDATGIGGVKCWEHDTIEGNKYTMAVTPHRCSSARGGYITECHQRGCQSNTFEIDPKAFCPDASCKIDTRSPFRIIERYEADSTLSTLARISTTLVQGRSTFGWETCADPDYLQDLTPAFKGNWTMVFQLWGDTHKTMEWLDKPTSCEGECIKGETETTFSDLAIRDLGSITDDHSLKSIGFGTLAPRGANSNCVFHALGSSPFSCCMPGRFWRVVLHVFFASIVQTMVSLGADRQRVLAFIIHAL